jgi:type VI secretion system protein ImpA
MKPSTEYSSTVSVDREKLLAPISPSAPAGESLRYEGTYDRIQEARKQDDVGLTMGVWERDLKEADWAQVSALCAESLERRAKDLQIAAWLMEAWTHLYGFAGAREGLTLIHDLSVAFWPVLHPPLDDPEYRLSIFQWMNDKLSIQLKFIPVTRPVDLGSAAAYGYADWEKASLAEERARLAVSRGEKPTEKKEEGVTIAQFQESVALTPPSFFESLVQLLRTVKEAAARLEAFLDHQYEKQAPTLRAFREISEAVESLIRPMAGPPQPGPTAKADLTPTLAPEIQEPPKEPPLPSAPSSAPPIQSRAEAYQRLAEAADYLFRTEPHSPTPYLVRKAISWGNMSLDELLPELVRNETALQETMKLLRIGQHRNAGPEEGK